MATLCGHFYLEKQMTYRAEQYKVLYHKDFCDGPLSGMLQLHASGDILYFHCVIDEHIECDNMPEDEKDYHWYRVYALFKPTAEQLEIIQERQKYFEQTVGNHTNWNYRWKDKTLNPRQEWDKFYKKEDLREHEPFSNAQIVGYTTGTELYKSSILNGQRNE